MKDNSINTEYVGVLIESNNNCKMQNVLTSEPLVFEGIIIEPQKTFYSEHKNLKQSWNSFGAKMKIVADMINQGKWNDEKIEKYIPEIKKIVEKLHAFAIKIVNTILDDFVFGTMDEFRMRLIKMANHLDNFIRGDNAWRLEAYNLFYYYDLYWYE